MEKVIRIFHYFSFIKYPVLIIGLYYFYKPLFSKSSNFLENYNYGLIFFGIALGLDSLKDYGKLTWLDKKVYHKPKIAKYYFGLFGLAILSIIIFGIIGYFSTEQSILKELSIGFIIFGIGTIGVLKSGIQATKDYMENKL